MKTYNLRDNVYVYCGSNKDDNTRLDKQYKNSSGEWYILHSGENISGAHVFVKSPSDIDLQTAAQIALYNSKARYSEKPVYVLYALARDIKLGSKAGQVVFPKNSKRIKTLPMLPPFDSECDSE